MDRKKIMTWKGKDSIQIEDETGSRKKRSSNPEGAPTLNVRERRDETTFKQGVSFIKTKENCLLQYYLGGIDCLPLILLP